MSNPANAIDSVQSCIRSLDVAMDDLKESLGTSPSGGVSRQDRDTEIQEWFANNFDISEHNLLDEDEIQSKCEYEAESAVDNIDWSDKLGTEMEDAIENVDLCSKMDDWACNVYLTKTETLDLIWETLSQVKLVGFREEVQEEEEAVNA